MRAAKDTPIRENIKTDQYGAPVAASVAAKDKRPGAAPRLHFPGEPKIGRQSVAGMKWSESVAQQVQTLFIDDIDGSPAEGTVRFALDGTEYEVDLNAEHAQQLRDALAAYVKAARRVNGSSRRPARTGRKGPANTLNPTEVRQWAKAQGIEVKDRGRVPAELVVKFKAATS
jgi:nucleoid-associated protein Lsr2